MYQDLEIILKELHPIKVFTLYDDITKSVMFGGEGWNEANQAIFYVNASNLDDLFRRFVDLRILPPLKRSE